MDGAAPFPRAKRVGQRSKSARPSFWLSPILTPNFLTLLFRSPLHFWLRFSSAVILDAIVDYAAGFFWVANQRSACCSASCLVTPYFC